MHVSRDPGAFLMRVPDLSGLYVAGGGITGVMDALREQDRFRSIVTVCHELTVGTRTGLIDGVVKLVISHPLRSLTKALVDAMARAAIDRNTGTPPRIVLPFELYTSESV